MGFCSSASHPHPSHELRRLGTGLRGCGCPVKGFQGFLMFCRACPAAAFAGLFTACLVGSLDARAGGSQDLHFHSRLAQKACHLAAGRLPADTSLPTCSDLNALVVQAREAVPQDSSAMDTIDRLNEFFFGAEGFQATYDLNTPNHLLLDRVLAGGHPCALGGRIDRDQELPAIHL